jgi:hypothetical protein
MLWNLQVYRILQITSGKIFNFNLESCAIHLSTVEWSELVSSQLISGLLQFGRCDVLLLEAGKWGTVIVWELKVSGTSAIESRYQATTGEDSRLKRFSACCSEL